MATFIFHLSSFILLSACTQDEIIAPQTPEAAVPQGMKTLTVDFLLPEGKPGFGEGETRATTTDGTWQSGDELMMRVEVKGFDDTKGYAVYESNMTLAYDGAAWDVVEDKSVTILEVASTFITNPPYVMLAQTADIDLTQPLTIKVPEDMTLDYALVFLAYGPEAEWNLTPDASGAVTDVRYKAKATATTAAPELWEYSSSEWSVNQARLRISTGQAGDVVTLTSSNFYPNSVAKSADFTYTATTGADGYAYFYGKAGTIDDSDNMVAMTTGFNVSLTAVTVGEGEAAVTCPVSPVTLLEASALVPVKLDAGESYRLDATAKRAAAADGIAVIDGTCGGKTTGDDTDVAAVKTQLETYLTAGKTTFVVSGASLAGYSSNYAGTVAGEAIRLLTMNPNGSSNTSSPYIGTIDLVLPDVTEIRNNAFYGCSALTSVSLPAATEIGYGAFRGCTALASVSAPAATSIGEVAFRECTALTSVSAPLATSIGNYAFYNCEAITSVSLPAATSIGDNAFNRCSALTSVELPLATSIGNYAFYNCEAITSVSAPLATSIGHYAFYNCSALTSVSAPLATSIGHYAFYNCSALTSLTFGKVITTVGDYAFNGTLADGSTNWTTQCALTLAAGQASHETLPAEAGENKTWAGKTWASITLK